MKVDLPSQFSLYKFLLLNSFIIFISNYIQIFLGSMPNSYSHKIIYEIIKIIKWLIIGNYPVKNDIKKIITQNHFARINIRVIIRINYA